MGYKENTITKTMVQYKDINKEYIISKEVSYKDKTKVYAISDIHGDFSTFINMLDAIDFSNKDELYILGDVIDRGPDGIRCLKYIMSHPNIYMILGNHELLMYKSLFDREYLAHWYSQGGIRTGNAFRMLNIKDQIDIIDFIASLPLSYNITIGDKKITLCHASNPCWFNEYANACLNDDTIENKLYNIVDYSVWYRGLFEFAPDNAGLVIIGHTPTSMLYSVEKSGQACPISFRNKNNTTIINIDCGNGYRDDKNINRLACINITDMELSYL